MTAGAGHRRAAEAIAQAARAAYPHATVLCRDLLEDVPSWLRHGYPWIYYALVRHAPRIWGACFEWLDQPGLYRVVQPLRRAWNCWAARRFIRWLRREPPDLVLATHFFPADVFSACKRAGWLRAPLVVAITDLHPHRLWLSPQANAYICETPEGAATAEQRGIPRQRIHPLGIPIAGAFHTPFERGALEELFGLSPERRTVLVTSGGDPVGPFEAVVEALMGLEDALPGRLQLLVVCGENEAAVRRLAQRARESTMPVKVFGFINTMAQAMAASDLIVAKAGGMTVTEALGRGVPLVFYHAIPGQEQWNAGYVTRHGAALHARSPHDVVVAVRRLLDHPTELSAMRHAATALGRPDAATTIVARVVTPLLAVQTSALSDDNDP